ncbi:hypothetical protein Tdes44962_MAKER03312 [Teratosphaeria destructans]|uniref:Fork-head domain-containing protein n=1 Tax=Teratosphaeria destructans TaxID=418781 RepID=A0A9W7SQJ4_9PEZI|nr:hypothetical protein Tdes44962_MAKER03312 [Teratosphaeria destructans]
MARFTHVPPFYRPREPIRPVAVTRDVVRASVLKQELTLDIERLIKPYTQDVNKQPPFSPAELVVMAAVCLKEFWSNDSEIWLWIGRTFPYYRMRARKHWATLVVEGQEAHPPFSDFTSVFDDYDLPLRNHSPGSQWFEVTTMAARTFLRERLEPPRPGHFRILDLPAELRLSIFELILKFPRSGINCLREPPNASNQPHTTRIAVEVRVDESLRKPPPKTICAWAGWGHGVRVRSFARLFDLFLVNRQIYKEAMPIFYSNNKFHFEGAQSATTLLLRMKPARIEHLSYVRLGLLLEGPEDNKGEMSHFQLAMQALGTVRTLKVLAIELRSKEWLRVHRRHPSLVIPHGRRPQSILDVKGFEELAVAGSKAQETTVYKPVYDEEAAKRESSIARYQQIVDLRSRVANLRGAGRSSPTAGDAGAPIANRDIKREITELIAPYNERGDQPPFTGEEVVVMACAANDQKWNSVEDIMKWILAKLHYHREVALAEFIISASKVFTADRVPGLTAGIEDLSTILGRYDIPLLRKRVQVDGAVNSWYSVPDKMFYSAPSTHARAFLAKWLAPARAGHFHFLGLPPEVRNLVYDLLFDFSKTGIIVKADCLGYNIVPRYLAFQTVELEPDQESSRDSIRPYYNRPRGLELPKLSSLLALLCTCKQVCNEAMPRFYRNRFVLDLQAFSLLHHLAAPRAEHLSHVRLNLTLRYTSIHHGIEHFPSGLRALARSKHLQNLEVHIASERTWIKLNPIGRHRLGWEKKRTFKKMEEIPYMKDLVVLAAKVEKLTISGDCPQFTALVQKEKDKLEAEAAASLAGANNGKTAAAKKKPTKEKKPQSKPAAQGIRSSKRLAASKV